MISHHQNEYIQQAKYYEVLAKTLRVSTRIYKLKTFGQTLLKYTLKEICLLMATTTYEQSLGNILKI